MEEEEEEVLRTVSGSFGGLDGALADGQPVDGHLGDAVVVHERGRHDEHVEDLVALELQREENKTELPLFVCFCFFFDSFFLIFFVSVPTGSWTLSFHSIHSRF